MSASRPLSLFDLDSAGAEVRAEVVVQRLRDSHHAAARLLAEGKRPVEVAYITGYSASRIATLQSDPSFKELVQYYRDRVEEVFVSMQERLAVLGMDAVVELQARLDEEPEKISVGQLIEITKTTADRTGNGPSSRQINEQRIVVSAEQIRAIREKVGQENVLRLEDAQTSKRPDFHVLDVESSPAEEANVESAAGGVEV